ncbi:ATP-binding cassette domain-containing protein [Vibrio sp. M60_M31a]
MLVANNVNIQIESLTLAKNFNFTLEPGQVTAVLGPNGAGKSTLLKAIFGDVNLASGSISHYGDELDSKSLLLMACQVWLHATGHRLTG